MNADYSIGVCLGASTISAVKLKKENNNITVEKIIRRHHEGNPKDEFAAVMDVIGPKDGNIMVTGRSFRDFVAVPSITEPEASEYALEYVNRNRKQKYDALVSAGGETFMVYRLDSGHKVAGISTGNKCASGTGEFFLQQIKRMNLGIHEAIDAAEKGTVYQVSGRCSVFCKSDCTHALNKGVPVSDVTAGLCRMIGDKITELIIKIPHERIMVVGGTSLNRVVMSHVKKSLKHIDIPEEAPYFEALGAALAGFEKGVALPENYFNSDHSSFAALPPLKDGEKLVKFSKAEKGIAVSGDKCIIGLDVGSTTTKAVLLRVSDDKVLSSVYLRTNGNPIEASRQCYYHILDELDGMDVRVTGIGVTGSGRRIAALYSLTDGVINEIIAHAAAAVHFDPEVDTIFEIGGQDAKYTHLTNSVASDYAMNEACSAGTGSFLEEAAYESFNVDYKEIADLAVKGGNPPNFSDQCAAFISSDIKNASHEGIGKNDILAGLVYSICFNYANRVKGHRPVGGKIFMQGGVCYNRAVPLAMALILNKEIVVPPDPGLMGAFGVALELKKRINLGLAEEGDFDIEKIIHRRIKAEKSFICAGGKEKCDLKCSISRIKIEEKTYNFGGACSRYYNMRIKADVDPGKLDFVKERNRLMFEKYAPPMPVKENAPAVGINRSLLVHRMFPLYYNFFANLGCRIILPDKVNEDAFDMQTTSFCFPAQVAIGLFDNLADKKPDYYFMPHLEEIYVPNGIKRKEFSATCIFTQGEGMWMRQTFRDKVDGAKILTPTLNFSKGFEAGRGVFSDIAEQIGFSGKEGADAFDKAVKMQKDARKERKEAGKKLLEELHKDPEKTAVVLFGHPHNAFAGETNKGIPRKFSSRGHIIIPFDMISADDEPLAELYEGYMHWEMGQKIIKAAQTVSRDPQLYGVFITNFLCAIDSLLVTYFRRTMGTKPSLTLEIDGHTADAGIDTRVEAFLDVVKNFRELKKDDKKEADDVFRQAEIIMSGKGAFYLDSKGRKTNIKDPSVKLIIPSMGDLSNTLLASAFRRVGINAEGMPKADQEVLRLGRSVTTGKECLPMIICLGSMMKYIKHHKKPGEKLVVFQPKAAGYCRFGQYHIYMNMLIREKKLEDVALISLASEEGYAGLGPSFTINAWKALVAGDILDDIRNAIRTIAIDAGEGLRILDEEHKKIMDSVSGVSGKSLYRQLKESAAVFSKIQTKIPVEKAPTVPVMGEIFVRRDAFSNRDIAQRLADKGFIAKTGHITEWLHYVNYMIEEKLQEPEHDNFLGWVDFLLSSKIQKHIDKKIKKIMEKSGLYLYEEMDMESIIKYSKHLLPPALKGEPGITLGIVFKDVFNHHAGAVNIGPFSCMPVRFTEALAANNMDMKSKMEACLAAGGKEYLEDGFNESDRIPFLTIEADGNPYPQLLEARFESFCLQAKRVAEKQGKIIPPDIAETKSNTAAVKR
ncbi:MAG: acyl-CoA dehydratase activase [Candidatus Goldiibacteriota bacterium]